MTNNILFLLIISGLCACGASTKKQKKHDDKHLQRGVDTTIVEPTPTTTTNATNEDEPSGTFYYKIDQPSATIELPAILKEISGLAIYKNEFLVAVQDEIGTLFFLNKNTGELQRQVEFDKKGDFEAVRFAGEELFIARADGLLFQLTNWKSDKPNVTTHDTPADESNDIEGLEYDAPNHRLLLSFKNSASLYDKERDKRSIYAFDLKEMKLNETPVYTITIKMVQDYIKKNPNDFTDEDAIEKMKKGKHLPIMPSEIAIHPLTKDIYILAATGQCLMVLSPQGKLLKIVEFPYPAFEQMESLAFAPNGDMYIASEGRANPPLLWRFDWKK